MVISIIYLTPPEPISLTPISVPIHSLRPRQNRRHFEDNIFKCIFLNEDIYILIKISLKFIPMGPINNIPALFQIMVFRWPGDEPLSEPMMIIYWCMYVLLCLQ